MFSGDLTINSVPTLEFASNLGDKVNIVNGNVFIEQNADMDPAVLQEVCDRLMTITGNINIRAQTSSAPAVQFPNLTGVTNVVIAQAGSISFPALLSSSKIVLGDNYSSRVDGVIDFSALTRVNSISTATVNVGWALASEALNTISFSKASNMNFAAVPYYSPRTLIIVGDQNTDLNLASLENKDVNGNARDYTLNIDGAAELNVPGVLDGKITVTDVVNVILPEYVGEITVNSGVEILTMGKLSENLTATGNENDLITVDITSASAGVEINFTGATALTDAKIAGKLKTATFSGNADLTSLIISAELINLTINNTALAEASLDHTNGDLAKGGSLVVTNNEDLVTLAASKIDGLKTLTITNNDELESISFDSLAATPTDGSGVSVTIGGSAANANALNAFDILQENATDGTFNSGDSGLDSLKAFLTAAAAINASTLTVYFDSADTYTSAAGVTTNNLTIAANAGNLVVVNKDASTGDSGAKRSWVITATGSGTYDLTANGATITFNQEATNASTVAGILAAANLNNFDANGVTLTANANAAPQAMFTLSKLASDVVTSTTVTSTANAESISLSIGDYSAKLYLVTTADAGFTAKPISDSNKAAENQFVVTGSTLVNDVLMALALEFNNPMDSPYNLFSISTGAVSQTATIRTRDLSDAHNGKAVKFTQTSSSGASTHLGALQINTVVGSDDVLQGTDVQVTLTSKVPGETLSTIGNPPNGLSFTATVTAAAGVAGFSAVASGSSIGELGAYSTVTTLAGTTYTKSNSDSGSATNVGLNGTMGANLNRIPWL
ncbi:hypothetical protein N9F74_02000 [Flavobacteriaceae bacterium]|nr:hypothetical protein [Flavobacteriaceae bacterium]